MLHDIAGFAGTRLGPGTLYGAIERLEADGLIEALDEDDRRVPYRLTEAGQDHLRLRMGELTDLLSVARERVGA
jgi:DNA-binding PadR family transcriptional regulator